jgi:4-amino-4-deoxychorismate lyase
MMLVNGHAATTVALLDRGLLYGDGVFETIAVADGRARELNRHLRRLLHGCDQLGMIRPDVLLLRREAERVYAGAARAVMKIIVTRGSGGRGYRPSVQSEPTRILMLTDWSDNADHYRAHGIDVTLCRTRLGRNSRLAGIKHLNRLEQVLARGEWQDEYQEGLLLDTDGCVVEGTMSNVFAIRDGALSTPALQQAGVAGIMRERVLETASQMNIGVQVQILKLSDIEAADALFFCNSLIGIWPVRRFQGSTFGDHQLTRELMARLELP